MTTVVVHFVPKDASTVGVRIYQHFNQDVQNDDEASSQLEVGDGGRCRR